MLLTSAANLRASKKGRRSNRDSSLGFDIQVGNAIPFSEKKKKKISIFFYPIQKKDSQFLGNTFVQIKCYRTIIDKAYFTKVFFSQGKILQVVTIFHHT